MTIKRADQQTVARHAMYLMLGAQDALRKHAVVSRLTTNDVHTAQMNGHLEMVSRLSDFAVIVADHYVNLSLHDIPGIFEYEVTEWLGTWAIDNFDASILDFTDELERQIYSFLAGHPSTLNPAGPT